LNMLVIIFVISSVVSIMSVGAGAQKAILGQISSLGTNTLDLAPGSGPGDPKANQAKGFTSADLAALSTLSYVDAVSPSVSSSGTIRYHNLSGGGSIQGVSPQYFKISNQTLATGKLFDDADVKAAAQVVVISDDTAKTLFPDGEEPLGKVIFLGAVPAQVIGVAAASSSPFGGFNTNLQVWVPYTTVAERMARTAEFRSLTIKLADGVASDIAQDAVTKALTTARGRTDFFVRSSESIRQTINQVTTTFSVLMGAIGGISLVVGGIGVMNIMLVSVSERTKEIGVRSAIGARRSDIMSQFMIEAVLVCLIGGAFGLGLSMAIAALVHAVVKNFELIYSPGSIIAAFATASLIGLIFGWLPARNASRLDPIEALARE
ncbi:MAG: macB, partial [Caulobacteraceae bacterium]|nr:macB [Caulobacteraceae bacterium]